MPTPARFPARRFTPTTQPPGRGGEVVPIPAMRPDQRPQTKSTWETIPGQWGPAPIPEDFEIGDHAEWLNLPTSGRIRYAARNLLVIRLRYRKLDGQFIDRIVEPYSYRVKRPAKPGASEHGLRKSRVLGRQSGSAWWYFFAFDQTRDQTIKSFIVARIVHVEVGRESYFPRWDVEF